tara:strand:- start:1009 stop:1866 length:858 start_codon:yes stop_codon:yes gene_type:complete
MTQGFSGGSIIWHKSHVVKVAAGPEQNEKVAQEIVRIQYMARKFKFLFEVPTILRSYVNKRGALCYEMGRVNVPRLEDILPNMGYKDVMSVAAKLSDIINQFSANNSPNDQSENEDTFIRRKLCRACEYVNDYNWPKADEYSKMVRLINLKPTREPTFSHGDMAMDNILYDGTKITLIDPLCQGFENFHWDAAKLMQSALCHWKEIRTTSAITPAHHTQLYFAEAVLDKIECCKRRLVLYLATTLARIIPYCHTSIQQFRLLSMAVTLLKQYLTGTPLKPIGLLM